MYRRNFSLSMIVRTGREPLLQDQVRVQCLCGGDRYLHDKPGIVQQASSRPLPPFLKQLNSLQQSVESLERSMVDNRLRLNSADASDYD